MRYKRPTDSMKLRGLETSRAVNKEGYSVEEQAAAACLFSCPAFLEKAGLPQGYKPSLQDLADVMGIGTREGARRIEQAALRKIRNAICDDPFFAEDDYLKELLGVYD